MFPGTTTFAVSWQGLGSFLACAFVVTVLERVVRSSLDRTVMTGAVFGVGASAMILTDFRRNTIPIDGRCVMVGVAAAFSAPVAMTLVILLAEATRFWVHGWPDMGVALAGMIIAGIVGLLWRSYRPTLDRWNLPHIATGMILGAGISFHALTLAFHSALKSVNGAAGAFFITAIFYPSVTACLHVVRNVRHDIIDAVHRARDPKRNHPRPAAGGRTARRNTPVTRSEREIQDVR